MQQRIQKARFVFVALMASSLLRCVAAAEEPADPQEAARQERLRYMTERFGEFQLAPRDEADRALDRTAEPLLRWSNPVRNFFSDGAMFVWLDGERPVAAATMSIRGNGNAWHEFVSLTDQPLRCERDGRVVWSPEAGGFKSQPLPEAPQPAVSERLRLAQMRQLARRFRFELNGEQEVWRGELRLLAQPVYRYSDERAGIVDGALFAFAQTTDPEALLVLEAHRSNKDADPVWRFTLARMTSIPLVVHLDDREVWTTVGYWSVPRSPNSPYIEASLGKYEPPADDSGAPPNPSGAE